MATEWVKPNYPKGMGERLAALFIKRERPALSYEQALTFGKWQLCEALCVINGVDRIEHTVDVLCSFTYDEGRKAGEWVCRINKQWFQTDMRTFLHAHTYTHIATHIDNDHCSLMFDLEVKVISITDNNRK